VNAGARAAQLMRAGLVWDDQRLSGIGLYLGTESHLVAQILGILGGNWLRVARQVWR
jgi:hypothetical protein